MSTLLVNQPFGAGDIIWEQTIVRRLAEGRRIVWPVFKHFVEMFKRAYPDIEFVDWDLVPIDRNRRDFYTEEIAGYGLCEVLPLRHADTIMKVPFSQCMASKYSLVGMDYHDWKEQAMWHRDEDMENSLFNQLGCDEVPYNLVGCIFGSDSQLRRDISPENNLRNIYMETISPYSLFDWAKVIENADAIHVVSSSSLYLFENLELKALAIDIYCRVPIEKNLDTVDYIFEKHKYNLHL